MPQIVRPRRTSLAVAALLAAFPFSPVFAQPLVVTTLADSGPGSLREAIAAANVDGGPTTITFAPGLAGGTIVLQSELPALDEGGTTIDGDLNDDCVPDIEIDGSGAGIGPYAAGLCLCSNGNSGSGLAIHSFSGTGVAIVGSGNLVACSYIGTDLAGTPGLGNAGAGIEISGHSPDNFVGPGNWIVTNGASGVAVRDGMFPGVYPEFDGWTADAVAVFAVLDFEDTAGGFESADGIRPLDGSGAPFRDEIGLRLSGTITVTQPGTYTIAVDVDDQVRILVDGGVVHATNNGQSAVDVILGGAHGFEVDFLEGCGWAHLVVGVSGPGTASLTTDGAVGGACAGGQPGLCGELFQLRQPSEGNTITENAISENGWLGIDLGACGGPAPEVNDAGDLDVGPNTFLNHPVIASVASAGAGSYVVSGTAPPGAIVELFVSDGDPSGFGEGAVFLAATPATAGGAFAATVALGAGDELLTATATDAAGNTSEFGPDFVVSSGQDAATVDGTIAALPGATVEIPVYARDASLTPLGVDRPVGERIQSLAFKVTFAPAAAVASKTLARAGITGALTPTFEGAPTTAATASYIGAFDETTNPIPFTLDGAAPGDQILKIVVTLAADAPAGTIALTLDAATTELANQAGTLAETHGNGWLALHDGQLTVLSNAAGALRSYALSSSTIQLAWDDPNANETGFRLERSTDGASWAPIATLGPDDTGYLDATGLAPATLYYHRLVTLTPADGHASNLAAAATFPAVAAKVCAEPIAAPVRSHAASPRVAWGGGAWGMAWYGREGTTQDEIWFQSFHATTLAPLGPPSRVAASASPADRVRADRPALAWSDAGGGHWGVVWPEGLPGEPGTPLVNTTFFALLAPDGSVERGGVRLSTETYDHPFADGLPAPLLWDGTHWGIFELAYVSQPMLDLVYRRLDEDGDVVVGPVTVLAPPDSHVADIAAAWNPATSKYGLAWTEIRDTDIDVYFQLMEESTGALEGSPIHLDDYLSVVGTYGFSVVADGTGWAVAWTDLVTDLDLGEVGVSWLRRFDASGAPLGPAMRLSDDPVTDGGGPLLARKPGGGLAAFLYCFPGNYEVCRLETDAAGNRIGGLTEVSSYDGATSLLSAVAGNGTDFLVAFDDRAGGSYELTASLVPAADFSTPGAPQGLTAGHEIPSSGVGSSSVVPLGAGFAAVWLDTTGGSTHYHARTWDGAGATVATLSPLDPAPGLGRPGVAGVGDSFAVAWRSGDSNDLWFARYGAAGSPLVARTSVSTLAGFRTAGVAMAFSGESYGIVWARSGGNGLAFQRVAPDGTPEGSEVLLPVGSVVNVLPQIQWTGHGWAIVWVEADWAAGAFNLQYALLARDGTPTVPEASVATVQQAVVVPQLHLLWNGLDLYLAWSALEFYDPPLQDIYVVRLNPDGSSAFPPVTAVSTPLGDQYPALYWTHDDSKLHLLHQPGGLAGEREVELQSDGTVLPGERWWTNRSLGGVAWNGATLGYVFGVEGNLFFETGECVTSDATPPPCPELTVGSFDEVVRLDWNTVVDPESGVFRYHVLRDGLPLGKTWANETHFDDGGFGIGATHLYEVRALNAAWNESEACAAVFYSTTAGDANGDGGYGVADIFYLINFFFADGPPPAGNADANGDNSVSVTDIFYLINDLFGEGPPPVPRGQVVTLAEAWEGDSWLESARVPGGGGSTATSWLVVGSGSAAPGHTVRIPIDLYDMPGTPLGPERPFGERIQALALHVRCAPCDGVAALAVEPAGALAAAQPTFQSRPAGPGSAALIASYDEAASPLFAAAPSAGSRQRVGWVVVRLTEMAAPGSSFEIRLDPGTTTLSNDGGTRFETVGNGWLRLRDGRVGVGAPRRLEWR